MRKILLPTLLLPLLAACQSTRPKPAVANNFIQGRAKVLEVHDELGYALLAIDGTPTWGYWETHAAVPQQSTIDKTGPWGAAVGQGKDPIVHPQIFPAKPGDTIAFRGLKTGGDILLRGVEVISH